ncbi:MAG: hypothetical protein V4850_04245 [Myxococcota bacterium]
MTRLLSAIFVLFVGCAPAVSPQCGAAPAEDDCTYERCMACTAHCGDDCVAEESNPPNFSCPDGESFDECPG